MTSDSKFDECAKGPCIIWGRGWVGREGGREREWEFVRKGNLVVYPTLAV
jgi:hypothetical protein